jgi:predicted RecA/RadA family phage recombinase
MKNFVQPGDTLTVTAPYDVASGAGMLVGLIFVVAAFAALSGAQVEGVTKGVFDLTALSADTATVGAAIYWDNTNKRCTTTSSGNTKIGVATQAKANGDTTVRVRLNGVF